MMIRYLHLVLWPILFLVLACGGAPVNLTPEVSHPAMQHLQKGVGLYQRGCFQASLDAFTKAHELFTAADLLPGVAMSLNNIGNVYRYIGDSPSALLFFEEAYEIYIRLDDRDGAIQALSNKAAVLIQNDRLDAAENTLNAAETMARASGKIVAHVLNNKGILLMRRQQYDAAEFILQEALGATATENLHGSATIYSSLGNLMAEKADYETARKLYEKALDLDRQSGFHPGLADNLKAIGKVCRQQGLYAQTTDYLQRSVKIYAILGNREQVKDIMTMLEESAARANIDLTMTRHFVHKWSNGQISGHPCP